MESQAERIAELLSDGNWHCTNEMYEMWMADPRTRLCELKKKGYVLEGIKCTLHNNHRGGSKMWKMIDEPPKDYSLPSDFNRIKQIKNAPAETLGNKKETEQMLLLQN